MKAIVLTRFGSSDNFVEADLPLPAVGPGEVRVKIHAAAFNPVDYQRRQGRSESKNLRSMILGCDFSGQIEMIHRDVADFSVGDEVFGYVCDLASSGSYAEYVCIPKELIAKKPASLTHAQAAAVPVAFITAHLALRKVQVNSSESLFAAGGSGGVGSALIALSRMLGISNLVTTAGSAESRAFLIDRCGLHDDQIVNYKNNDFVERALERNRGRFDAAIDLVGGAMLSACCTLVGLDGQVASATEAPGLDDFETLFQKNGSFHSIGANAYSLIDDRRAWRTYRLMLEGFAHAFDDGTLASPHVEVIGALSADVVRRAHALLEAGGVQGKLVMTV